MNNQALKINERERTIDALARNNNIIKSLFHFDNHITFLIVSLSIQKIKINAHKGGLVIITRPEIKSLTQGKNKKIGINKLIKLIRKDLEIHNFFNLYDSNSGLKDIRQGLIQKTATTQDLFEDLVIHFDQNMFDIFKSINNYTIQSLDLLRDCNENQTTIIYTLTQPHANPNSPDLQLNILEVRLYLRIADDAYLMPRTLTMRIKKICLQVTKKTNITLTVKTIPKNGDTGVTIGYQFHSEFKKQKNTAAKIEDAQIIKKPKLTIRQQLTNWGVSKKQINTWLDNLDKKTINDAIKQTLKRPVPASGNSNAGGYLFSILGNGKQPQLTRQIQDKEVVGCLKVFGLNDAEIKKVKSQIKQKSVITAVTNKCLRELAKDSVGTEDMRNFFLNEFDDIKRSLTP